MASRESGAVLAIDIGGTKFAAGLVGADGEIIVARRVATPPGGDAETLWTALTGLVDTVVREADEPVTGVGVGCGGPMTWPDGEVSPLNMPGWRGFPLRERLAGRFPGVPVRVHNDAVCVAVAEHWRGAGRGSADMLGMVVSTGVGGGLVLGGRLIDGGTGNAGHIGHVVVDPEGPACECGGRGCLEAIARGPGLAAWALAQGWLPGHTQPHGPAAAVPGGAGVQRPEAPGEDLLRSGVPGEDVLRSGMPGEDVLRSGALDEDVLRSGVPGEDVEGAGVVSSRPEGDRGSEVLYVEAERASGRRLAEDAAAGDPVARAAFARAGRALGIAIASATHLCDLDVVTIGGGLSQAGPLLFDPLERALREHARLAFAARVRVVPAALGQDAGLIGAAALILAEDHYWTAPNLG
ncbi:ROK family protein [Sphaerisporangium krabiense]|uniref:Glucokinase n=1 Tax=Sphaerisporangium krabiense TaxID=763782 RepID=A0A7W8Z577_9ACTN|nr:ROK family protein [Sphaerisporangium krabiense]MBB5627328.1 glucokinase [Sphaerisporangium krabiense]